MYHKRISIFKSSSVLSPFLTQAPDKQRKKLGPGERDADAPALPSSRITAHTTWS